jgi:hypothetical protein
MSYQDANYWDMTGEEFAYLRQLIQEYRKSLVDEFEREYTESLDRFFMIGYIDLRTYLKLRANRGRSTKFSKIVKLLVKRTIRFIGVD